MRWPPTGPTPRARATSTRSPATYRHDLLALALRVDESRARDIRLPRVLVRRAPAGGARGRATSCSVPDAATTPALRSGSGCGPARSASRSAPPGSSPVSRTPPPTTPAACRRLRRRDRPLPAPGLPPSTARGSSTPRPPCSGVDHDGLSRLALAAAPGAGGLVHVPYLEGERTPNLPHADRRAARHDAGQPHPGEPGPRRGRGPARPARPGDRRDARARGAWSRRSRCSAAAPGPRPCAGSRRPSGACPSTYPSPGEYVADGAARQAAWVLVGRRRAAPVGGRRLADVHGRSDAGGRSAVRRRGSRRRRPLVLGSGQPLQLAGALVGLAALVVVERVDLDLLRAPVGVVSGEHGRGRAGLVHQGHREQRGRGGE